MSNPFQGNDPQDARALAQRTFTAGPAGPVPGVNAFKVQALPLPALDLKAAALLIGPQG